MLVYDFTPLTTTIGSCSAWMCQCEHFGCRKPVRRRWLLCALCGVTGQIGKQAFAATERWAVAVDQNDLEID
jgi:hypothetical protein